MSDYDMEYYDDYGEYGEMGGESWGAWAILAAIYGVPLMLYDYYQTVNLSPFYIMFWPIAFFWYLFDMEGWDVSQLDHYTFDFFEAIIFTEINWEHLDLKWFKLHYLYLPYMIGQFTEGNANDWVIPMMFVTLFDDWLAFLSGFISLTVFFPLNIAYWIVFFIGQFVSLGDWEHDTEASLYEDEGYREWDHDRKMKHGWYGSGSGSDEDWYGDKMIDYDMKMKDDMMMKNDTMMANSTMTNSTMSNSTMTNSTMTNSTQVTS